MILIALRFALITLMLAAVGLLTAQTPTASLVGTLRDGTGAVLQDAKLTVRHLASGTIRQSTSGPTGDYTFIALPIGEFEIEAEHEGFQKQRIVGIVLQVNQTARVDFNMSLGSVAETVTVSDEAPLVRSEEASVGTVVENAKVTTLPLNGRDFRQLATLSPGVIGQDRNGIRGNETITGTGLRGELSSTKLDGIENSSIQEKFASVVTPSVEAIEEFRVETGNYQADHGTGGGVVVNASIKSGTNGFHGVLYEFLRNEKLDAKNLFDSPTADRPPLRQNQFGASFGGPILRNRTFFFFNYEAMRVRRSSTLRGRVPTAAEKAGDYAGQATIYDPTTTVADPSNPGRFIRQPFAGNQVPTGRFDPIYNIAKQYWPEPNNPAGAPNFNYLRVASRPDDTDQFHIRVDHHFSAKDTVFIRYSKQDRDIYSPGTLPDVGGATQVWDGRNGVASYTRVFNPTLLNEFKFGYTRWVNRAFDQNQDKIGVGEGGVFPIGGFQGVAPIWRQGFPYFGVTGMIAIAETGSYPEIDNRFQWLDTLSWTTSRHTIRIGGEFAALQENMGGGAFTRGGWDFSGQYTGVPLNPQTPLLHGLPDFQLGLSSSQRLMSKLVQEYWRYFRRKTFGAFVNNTFKATRNLTLDMGLRYSVLPGGSELHGYLANFDLATGEMVFPSELNPLLDSLGEANIPFRYRRNGPNELHATDKNNIAPRFGFAYRPFGNNHTVVRGGYGIYYGQGTTRETNAIGNESPPAQVYRNLTGDPVNPTLNPLYVGLPPISGNDIRQAFTGATIWGSTFNWQDPLIQQWNLSVQRLLPGDMALELSYVGNKANHVEFIQEDNQPTPLGPGDPKPRMPYQPWNRVNIVHSHGNSHYHALLTKLEKRYSSGLSFIWSYAYGKAIGDKSASWTTGDSDSTFPMDSRNLRLEKARLGFDVRHVSTFSFLYELPFGSGKPMLDSEGVLGKIVSGWQTGGILSFQSGHPFTIRGGAVLNIPNVTDNRPNRVGDGDLPVDERTIERWFDKAAFAAPPPYTFGNSGKNIIDSPGRKNLDLIVLKSTEITESHRLEFRAEFFNLTNTPPLNRPNNTITSALVGQITSAGLGREIQLGLRYVF
jgi:hypothetical protein